MLKENNQLRYQALPILSMPAELRSFVLNNCQNPSPFNRYNSGSFYNTTEKSWSNTPDGTIRVSDHWNFYSRGEMHCVTDVHPEKLEGKWAVGQYNSQTNSYTIIALDEKDFTEFNKRNQRQAAKDATVSITDTTSKRIQRAAQLKETKEAAIRVEKIKKGKIWVAVNVNTWSGHGRKVKFAGTETIVGQLTWESQTGSSFKIKTNGNEREIRKYNSYKELNRKPYTRKTTSAA